MKLNDSKIVVAIENAVCHQLEASGIKADPFRLDGEKIIDVILEQLGDFVVVPKEPTKEFKDVISQYLDELWMGEWGCDWDGFICVNGIDPNHVWKIVTDTKAMIEAREQTND